MRTVYSATLFMDFFLLRDTEVLCNCMSHRSRFINMKKIQIREVLYLLRPVMRQGNINNMEHLVVRENTDTVAKVTVKPALPYNISARSLPQPTSTTGARW